MTGHTIRSSNNAAAKGKKGKQSEFFASMETLPRTFFFCGGQAPPDRPFLRILFPQKSQVAPLSLFT